MSTMMATSIYEEHIRTLPAEERLKLIALIAADLAQEHRECEVKPRRSIMEFHGVGKGSRNGEDAQEYVNRLRDGWEDPLP